VFEREVTVVLKKELVRVTSSNRIANGVNVQMGGYCCATNVSVIVTPLENIANGVRTSKGR
jgi:hypothetical protein